MKFDIKYKIIFFCFVLLIGGCAAPTVRTYEGKLPLDKIAIIETTKSGLTTAKVQKVDGERIRPDARKIEMLPGEHLLICYVERIYHMLVGWVIEDGTPQTLTIQAEAGHVYKVYGKWNSIDDTPMWIVDEQTGAVVAGDKQE
jgi:hypothetical protein